jgi:hypothetical protein
MKTSLRNGNEPWTETSAQRITGVCAPRWANFGNQTCALMKATLRSPGITTTGSTMVEHNYYVSAYRILYSDDGQKWTVYREPGVEQDKVKLSPRHF